MKLTVSVVLLHTVGTARSFEKESEPGNNSMTLEKVSSKTTFALEATEAGHTCMWAILSFIMNHVGSFTLTSTKNSWLCLT